MAGNAPGARRAVLIVNLGKESAAAAAAEIRGELEARGDEVSEFSFEGRPGPFPAGAWDIAFSLGGDGTALYAARMLAGSGTPILPARLGTLGFLAGVGMGEWRGVYGQWLEGSARASRRCMFAVSVEREGRRAYSNTCLNDAVISSVGIAALLRLRVSAGGGGAGAGADLGCYRADGLVIATPTGSTAYSMAAGGPIVDPEMEARIVSPICPFSLSNRPLVLPSRQALRVDVERGQKGDALLTIDGQDAFALEGGDAIEVGHFPHPALLLGSGSSAYYSALREKLAWQGGGPGPAGEGAARQGGSGAAGFGGEGGAARAGGALPGGGDFLGGADA